MVCESKIEKVKKRFNKLLQVVHDIKRKKSNKQKTKTNIWDDLFP